MSTIQIGTWTSDPGRVWFTRTYVPIVGQTGRTQFIEEIWNIRGSVSGTSPSNVDAKKNLMEAAIGPGVDIVFSFGTYSLLSSNCIRGTIIRKYEWLAGVDPARGSAAQGVNRRDFNLIISGTKLFTSDIDYIFFQESATAIGSGAPITKMVRSLAGLVQPQQTCAYTEFYYIQSGTAVGLTDYPLPNTPIYIATPGVYQEPLEMSVERTSPKELGININTQFATRWRYKFAAPSLPLTALPSIPF